ncbi:hypothetical protein [Stella sp.]|uniref:hypothetical protein n=1 Tax=Stella sp. TaxID=2912054 RepID=UPI0035B2C3B8
MEIAAVGLALLALALYLLRRAPAVRLASLGLLLLSAVLGWFAWSEGGGIAGP